MAAARLTSSPTRIRRKVTFRNHAQSTLAFASLFVASSALVVGCEERREPWGIERVAHEIDDAVEDIDDSVEDLGEEVDESTER